MSSGEDPQAAAEADQLVQSPESADLEFKADLRNEKQAARLIAAMANSGGGKIVFGVSEGKPVGLKSPADTSRMAERAAEAVQPEVPIAVEERQAHGSPIVVAEVSPAGDNLYVPPDGAIVKRAADGRDVPVSRQDVIGAFAHDKQAPTASEKRLAEQLARVNEELLAANKELLAAVKKGFDDAERLSGWRGQWRGWVISAVLGAVFGLVLTLIFAP